MRFFRLFLLILIFSSFIQAEFKTGQLKYARVKTAYQEKEASLKKLFTEKGICFNDMNVFIRVFKKEEELEVWARSGSCGKYSLLKKYVFCNSSGDLGPKRRKGDGQTPEGFYHIDRFNPQSSYYLSLGINYPNISDCKLGGKDPGGDIFIHGKCVTIGCVPLTDDLIKEVYLLAVEAKNNGQSKIPVHIFPCRLTEENTDILKKKYCNNTSLLAFWENLQEGYRSFEKNRIPPGFTISASGKYIFKKQ